MNERTYRILVVEDNPGDVYLLRKSLKHADVECELTVFEDGLEALTYIRQEASPGGKPDLAVLDLNLPKTGGTELVAALRESPWLRSVPVIVTSSGAISESTRNLPVDLLLPKPVDLPEFLGLGARIKNLLTGFST